MGEVLVSVGADQRARLTDDRGSALGQSSRPPCRGAAFPRWERGFPAGRRLATWLRPIAACGRCSGDQSAVISPPPSVSTSCLCWAGPQRADHLISMIAPVYVRQPSPYPFEGREVLHRRYVLPVDHQVMTPRPGLMGLS